MRNSARFAIIFKNRFNLKHAADDAVGVYIHGSLCIVRIICVYVLGNMNTMMVSGVCGYTQYSIVLEVACVHMYVDIRTIEGIASIAAVGFWGNFV